MRTKLQDDLCLNQENVGRVLDKRNLSKLLVEACFPNGVRLSPPGHCHLLFLELARSVNFVYKGCSSEKQAYC